MTVTLNTHPAPFVKQNGAGHARAKSIAACNAADAISAVVAWNPNADIDVVARALAKVLNTCPQYVGNALRLTRKQRQEVRQGIRPVIARSKRRPVELSRHDVEGA